MKKTYFISYQKRDKTISNNFLELDLSIYKGMCIKAIKEIEKDLKERWNMECKLISFTEIIED